MEVVKYFPPPGYPYDIDLLEWPPNSSNYTAKDIPMSRKTYIDEDGWTQNAPMSDRECIRQCLHNCMDLAGLDKAQVKRLYVKYGGKAVL